MRKLKFKVPFHGSVAVEASSLEEAVALARELLDSMVVAQQASSCRVDGTMVWDEEAFEETDSCPGLPGEGTSTGCCSHPDGCGSDR